MSSSPVLTIPDQRLRCRSAEIVDGTGLATLRDALVATMQAGVGGVGIAAPQIGHLVRMVVVDCGLARHPCANHGRLCMINPKIVRASGHKPGREGCLSVPEWVATVVRNVNIIVDYQDINLDAHVLDAKGFEARVLQHEIDHLDGILFIDRVASARDMVRRMLLDATK
ncbi:MAG: peptide deformylase [Mariprofundales bacterium]